MIRTWRIVPTRRASSAFDGEGARLFGGRWNNPGLPAVYTAESRALAVLEWLVHLSPSSRSLPLTLYPVSFPKNLVHRLAPETIDPVFLVSVVHPSTMALGDDWLRRQTAPVFRVPSAIIHDEFNYILNPRHPKFSQLTIGEAIPFKVDPRLAGGPPSYEGGYIEAVTQPRS